MSSSYKVTISSISNLSSLQIIAINYVLLPLISLVMFLLIAFDANQDYSRTLLGTVITSAISSGIGAINTSFVYDQNIGIFDDVVSIRPNFRKYLLPKFVIASLVSISEILLLGGVGLVALNKYNLFSKLFAAIPLVVIISSLLGFFGSVQGIKRNNPYWLTNIISGSLFLLAGVIIPISEYPQWLRIIAEILPISNLLDWFNSAKVFDLNLEIVFIKCVIWFIICLFCYQQLIFKLKK